MGICLYNSVFSCCFLQTGGYCSVRLSEPLLRLRSIKELKVRRCFHRLPLRLSTTTTAAPPAASYCCCLFLLSLCYYCWCSTTGHGIVCCSNAAIATAAAAAAAAQGTSPKTASQGWYYFSCNYGLRHGHKSSISYPPCSTIVRFLAPRFAYASPASVFCRRLSCTR